MTLFLASFFFVLPQLDRPVEIQKLSTPSPPTALGDVEDARYTPDGQLLLYLADQEERYSIELFSAHLASGEITKLNDELGQHEDVHSFGITEDGNTAVFTAGASVHELYSVPVDGSSSPQTLTLGDLRLADLPTANEPGFVLSPDSRLAFFAGETPGQVGKIYSMQLDGSSAPVPISIGTFIEGASVTPDSSRLVFERSVGTYSAPADGSVSPTLLFSATFTGWQVTPDGQQVLYDLIQAVPDFEFVLDSVPVNGGTPTTLGSGLAYILLFLGTNVIYFDGGLSPQGGIHIVPLDASAPASLIASMPLDRNVFSAEISPDEQWLGYAADVNIHLRPDLFIVPVDGSLPPRQVNPPLVAGGSIESFHFTADSSRMIYLADADVDEMPELFSAPVVAGGPVVQLNSEGARIRSFHLPALGTQVIVEGEIPALPGSPAQLRSVIQDGSAPSMPLTPLIDSTEGFSLVLPSPNSEDVAFIAGMIDAERFELFTVSLSGNTDPVRVNSDLGLTYETHVLSTQVSPDGRFVTYREHGPRLSVAPVDGQSDPVYLGALYEHHFTPDSARIVYRQSGVGFFRTSADGTEPPTLVVSESGPVGPFAVSPDSDWIVFEDEVGRLRSAVIDDTQADAVQLHFDTPPNRTLRGFEISPDSQRVVYVADHDVQGVFELYSVPVDASLPHVRLHTDPIFMGQPHFLLHGADVIFPAESSGGTLPALFRVPLDGSQPAALLADTLSSGAVRTLQASPDGSFVVYRQNNAGSIRHRLYSVPLSGGGTPLDLAPTGFTLNDVYDYDITANSTHVVMSVFIGFQSVTGIFSTPIDGSGPPVRLDPPRDPEVEYSTGFAVSPTGDRVAFSATPFYASPSLPGTGLFSSRADGSEFLELDIVPKVFGLRIAPGGRNVVYRAQHVNAGVELYRTPIEGGAPLLISPALLAGESVGFFHALSRGRTVFVSDHDLTQELFSSSTLPHVRRELGSPGAGGTRLVR